MGGVVKGKGAKLINVSGMEGSNLNKFYFGGKIARIAVQLIRVRTGPVGWFLIGISNPALSLSKSRLVFTVCTSTCTVLYSMYIHTYISYVRI